MSPSLVLDDIASLLQPIALLLRWCEPVWNENHATLQFLVDREKPSHHGFQVGDVRLEGNDNGICMSNILIETRSAGSCRVNDGYMCIWETDLIAQGSTLLHPRLGRLIRIRIDEIDLLTLREEPFR